MVGLEMKKKKFKMRKGKNKPPVRSRTRNK